MHRALGDLGQCFVKAVRYKYNTLYRKVDSGKCQVGSEVSFDLLETTDTSAACKPGHGA